MGSKICKSALVIVSLMVGVGLSAQQGMRLMTPMHETMSQLEEFTFTGNPDHDFAHMMLIHHKGSIKMLDEVLSKGTDKEALELAKKIRENQEKDISELEKFTTENSMEEPNSEFIKEMKSHLENAKEEMSRNMQLTGSIDKDFANLMSMHHEHGMDMARTQLKFGKNADLKQLANRILEDQQNELEQLGNIKDAGGMGKMRQESLDSASTFRRY